MEQYNIGKAVVRIHGTANKEKVKEAAEIFLKKAERKAKKDGKGKKNLLG